LLLLLLSLLLLLGLVIEKCRFLETSGCVQTCINACKVPTQNFFKEEMGLDVTLQPNITDYRYLLTTTNTTIIINTFINSCKFLFGIAPTSIDNDPISLSPCLSICKQNKNKNICLN